jgi:hypothetical protein
VVEVRPVHYLLARAVAPAAVSGWPAAGRSELPRGGTQLSNYNI